VQPPSPPSSRRSCSPPERRSAGDPGARAAPGDGLVAHLAEDRDEVRKEKIAIGHLLAETSFHAANGTSVCIACPDDFHADLLKRNRQYISQLAERIYGARVQFESILAAAPAAGDDDRPADGHQPAGGRSSGAVPRTR